MLGAGIMNSVIAKSQLPDHGMHWANDFSAGATTTIAALEFVGAIGLIAPLLTDTTPVLTSLAATELAARMVDGTIVQLRREEPSAAALVLAVLAIASAVLGFLVVL